MVNVDELIEEVKSLSYEQKVSLLNLLQSLLLSVTV